MSILLEILLNIFPFNTISWHIVNIKCQMFFVNTNEFILSLFPLCSMLVKHRNTKVYIGRWWVGTQPKIFSYRAISSKKIFASYSKKKWCVKTVLSVASQGKSVGYVLYSCYAVFLNICFVVLSTLVGYLKPDPVYTYIHIIYNLKANSLSVTFLNESELICLHIVKWFQVLLSNTNNSI